tara:strand:+ start:58 stop:1365 length:1308 start_codon:yes stop_codon:yes gene_type:complete
MTIKDHFKENIILAIPVIIGQLGHIMVSVADTIMVGQIGVIPLAGATFATAIYHVFLLFGLGVSYAITPLVAATSQSDKEGRLIFLQNGMLLNILLALIMFFITLILIPYLSFFGQQSSVTLAASPYLKIISTSLIPLMIFQTFRQFSEGQSNTLSPMIVSVLANLLNVLLNYVFIYGHWGFPKMGLIGAGYATLISRFVMVILMMVLTREMWRGFSGHFDLKVIMRLLRIGVPSGLQYVFEIAAFSMAGIMAGWISAATLAAHQIALNMVAVTYMAASGLGAAASIRIANQMGKKDLKNLKLAGFSSLALVAGFMFLAAISIIMARHLLIQLYIEDEAVQKIALGLLLIAAGFQISDGLQAVGLGILRGLTDVKIPAFITFFVYWICAIPGSYLLAFHFDMGLAGIWYALSGALTLAASLHIFRFIYLTKRIHF